MSPGTGAPALPEPFAGWFAARGWAAHPHQLELLARAAEPATLLIAPTGGGKTLAGFLPSLVELGPAPPPGLHTLYVSPLKALAADIRRNLGTPLAEMALAIRVEDRTGDTGATQRARQRSDPPHILLTTPESLALMLSYPEAPAIFGGVARVIVDEIHALAESKRGDQLMLGLARLQTLSPGLRRIGLSATIEDPPALAAFLGGGARILEADPGPEPDITILDTGAPPPWAGQTARHAAPAVMELIRAATTTLVFINTRAQAELFFQALWAENDEGLPIGLHHGSLSREARARVEAAMVAGEIRAIVATGSLDLGIDWGSVDLVIQVGAPKNVKRLVQRIGRANHRYNAPSRAVLVPANRFEVVECRAALDAVRARDLDGEPRGPGPLDVLCQHMLLTACAGPFEADTLFAEVRGAGPYRDLARADFDACLEYCATGGYALKAYDRWRRLVEREGSWSLRDPRRARMIRMNVGTIVDTETLSVRLKGRFGLALGEVEEDFAASLVPGDTFLIGGETVRYEGLREMVVEVSRAPSRAPKIAIFMGTKLATSTRLSQRVVALLADPAAWKALPPYMRGWLALQARVSRLPEPGRLLTETFRRGEREHLCLYGFAGRNAHQTLGLLVTRRMEAAGLDPLGFVATDYALLIWGLARVTDPAALLAPGELREGLEGWLGENAVMKRTFRNAATIAGLIERNLPGARKTGRQATFSTDILYDTLRRHDPDHLLLRITRSEAGRGLVDFGRIEEMLTRVAGRIDVVRAPHVTPLAAPLLLEVGRVPIKGRAEARLVAGAAEALLAEAGLAP
ncbi:MAG TPA: ligase-associated DNA damage response DEXH box helicase [Amaricoccus sp.]|uniref:ligase-associated DNA damage response DEXH box helicase n=1 Tax=Amaricoccus sp. TaxID=1872485 RepID=UPI002CCD3ABE|nr:ligase-associated DNA damage response DEXH box helicase [Amaricoccus sp.]HMQ92139.1 ligase-associated DNA damage response DEXH box helicase [Amaricoccus sp.]HMR51528.1 ligase-associated DNA damage response DEXH box helicase [Amaricoccus sp.]HMR59641.1 ligase-associated DNA damage response DEXH box helicase [Amaricoccus sp.]HMT98504.1 ligase-associated DNA damage response DEXH box helicase [Amaricoccus sp.]